MKHSHHVEDGAFSVAVEVLGRFCVVRPAGELDVATAPTLQGVFVERIVDGGHVDLVVDLSHLTFMDSTGLGTLVAALKWTQAHHGSFAVVCPEGPVRRVLAVTAMLDILRARDSLDPALAG